MTDFIFNHRITGEQQIVKGLNIASDHDLVFKGSLEDLAKFELDSSHVGGIEKGTKDFYDVFIEGTNITGTNSEEELIYEEVLGTNVTTEPWLYFNQDLFNQQLQAQKPILSGSELSLKLRNMFKGKSLKERALLLAPVLSLLNIMEKDEQIIQSEYDELKSELILGISDKLTVSEINLIEQTLDDWTTLFSL